MSVHGRHTSLPYFKNEIPSFLWEMLDVADIV